LVSFLPIPVFRSTPLLTASVMNRRWRMSLRHCYKIIKYYFKNMLGPKIVIPKIWLKMQEFSSEHCLLRVWRTSRDVLDMVFLGHPCAYFCWLIRAFFYFQLHLGKTDTS
jgi:hypothetical protein